ncbi:LCP family protein [Clostridium culturomicium]|uniref:LCP family protein n=1 Tax=Clostridium culturomicium TaxID=1499683 RepID=UPI003857550B
MENPKKKSRKLIIFSTITIVLLTLILSAGLFIKNIFGNIEKVEATPEDLGIEKIEKAKVEQEVTYGTYRPDERYLNIALLGVDTIVVGNYDGTRADSIMILSIDRETKAMKLASIARDTYANIEGYGMDKINHAYAYGGPNLMVKTLNQNFNLAITDYVVVNFFGMAEIIDRLGGVELEVDVDEIQYINPYIDEVSSIKGVTPEHITTPGTYNLNGVQAVAYSRIRYTDGGDFKRTERQREVLLKLAEKSSSVKITDVVPIINQLSSNLMTTLGASDMTNLAVELIKGGYSSNMSQTMFPEAAYSGGDMINGVYYYVTDLSQAASSINNFFYGE